MLTNSLRRATSASHPLSFLSSSSSVIGGRAFISASHFSTCLSVLILLSARLSITN